MARGRRPGEPENLSPYERRVFRATGYLPSEAKRLGLLQKARGHTAREKAQTAARQRERGELTETDRRFLKRQLRRAAPRYEYRRTGTGTYESVVAESSASRYQRAIDAYRALSPAQRDALRAKQQRFARNFRRRRSQKSRSKVQIVSRGGFGPAGFDLGDLTDDEGDEFEEEFEGESEFYEDYYEGEWPDIPEDLQILLFYHD